VLGDRAEAQDVVQQTWLRLHATTARIQSLADWEVVDAFMAAARNGDFDRLLRLLAPDAVVTADDAAVLVGTPRQLQGREEVATFFNGSAKPALPVLVGERPGAAWYHQGQAGVVLDFTVDGGLVRAVTFRAASDVLSRVVRRGGGRPRA